MPTDQSIKELLDLKSRHHYEDFARRRRNLRWTYVLTPIYLVSTFILTFYYHKLDGMQLFAFLISICIPIVVVILWLGINAKTKWKEAILYLKLLLFSSPFVLLAMIAPQTYQDHQIYNHMSFTTGIIRNTDWTAGGRGSGRKYHADIDYTVNGRTLYGRCGIPETGYEIGDTVQIVYSSEIPEFFRLTLKNK